MQTWRTLRGPYKGPHWSPGNQDHLKEEKETKRYKQRLLQGLAGIILRLTIVSAQGRTCAIIKVECCVYIPDLSSYISASLNDMKGQVKVMSDDGLPFWTSVLSRVKGDWWKTIFTIVAKRLKRLPAMQETWVRSLGREDPLEKEMATHSSILAWRIPWMEEPGRPH